MLTKKTQILLISLQEDPHAQYIGEILTNKQKTVARYDYDQYPTDSEISIYPTSTNDWSLIDNSGDIINLKSISAFLYRRPYSNFTKARRQDSLADYISGETSALLNSLPYITPNAYWLPHPEHSRIASRKAYQLYLASQSGLRVPATCISNSIEQTQQFAKHHNYIALKALHSANYEADLTFWQKVQRTWYYLCEGHGLHFSEIKDYEHISSTAIFTQKCTPQEIVAKSSQFKYCPIILQEYIPKQLELRLTVVGEQIFTAAMHSQKHSVTEVDWRKDAYIDLELEPFQLPSLIQEQCKSIVKQLGLHFGCIDLILTPENEYVFLEVNPNGQWLWIEHQTGMPIGEAIANLLIKHGNL